MDNIINNLTTLWGDMPSFLSVASTILLVVAVVLGLVAVIRSMSNVKERLLIEKIIVESLAETLKEKGVDSSITVKGNKLSVKLKCSAEIDPTILAEEIITETIRKASLRGYEVSKILDRAKSNESYINALFDKSLNIIHKSA